MRSTPADETTLRISNTIRIGTHVCGIVNKIMMSRFNPIKGKSKMQQF